MNAIHLVYIPSIRHGSIEHFFCMNPKGILLFHMLWSSSLIPTNFTPSNIALAIGDALTDKQFYRQNNRTDFRQNLLQPPRQLQA